MTIVYPPVSLVETVVSAGAPSTLQKTVAYVSFGATTLSVGTRQLVTQYSGISGSLPGGSWLIAGLQTFFAQGTAACYVIELGTVGSNVQALATAVLQHQAASIAVNVGGAGWTVSETFAFPGGTGHVSAVTGGVVTAVVLDTHPGQGTDPAGSGVVATATSGSGTGLTLNITSSLTGAVDHYTVTVEGAGYSSLPGVSITGGGGSGATAQATISGGAVTGLLPLTGGTSYTSAPTVTITAPPANISSQVSEYIQANPLQNYLYVIDATSSTDAGLDTLVGTYDSTTSYTYFLLTLNVSQATTFGTHKAAILFIPSASAPSTEFGASDIAFMFASLTPSLAAKIQPFNNRFVIGSTPYTTPSNPLLTPALQTNANIVLSAIAGGLPNNMLIGGQTSDGNAITIWYGADYASLTVTQALINEIINGANNSTNPLLYDQQGINRLLARATQTLNTANAVGAILAPFQISAVDFATYVLANPSDYQNGVYNGLAMTITPTRGFNSITYSLTVDLTAASVVATAQ